MTTANLIRNAANSLRRRHQCHCLQAPKIIRDILHEERFESQRWQVGRLKNQFYGRLAGAAGHFQQIHGQRHQLRIHLSV
jgi:hypothetical protein